MIYAATAVELLGHSAQGQTLPLIFECESEDGRRVVVQAKVASRRNGLTSRELACEVLCTLLATVCGLPVSVPVCVHLPQSVIEQVESRYAMGLTDSYCAGLQWVDYLWPFLPAVDISDAAQHYMELKLANAVSDVQEADLAHRFQGQNPGLIQLAAILMGLDLLIVNGDRTAANPNVAWQPSATLPMQDDLFVFDFEHCFELPGGRFDRTFDAHVELLPNLRESHLFGSDVQPAELRLALSSCIQSFSSGGELKEVGSCVPTGWQEHWLQLCGYVEYLCRHLGVIIDAATADI